VGDTMLYQNLVEIAEDYLGPSGNRFIERLAQSHCGKSPQQITKKDIPELSRWAQVSAAVLTDNAALVTEFSNRLLKLANKRSLNGKA